MAKNRRRFLPLLFIPILVVSVGVVGYVLIEGWSFTDAFFMTVITLTTVGFGETRPLSATGRWFTIVLILLGVGSVVYSLSVASEYLLTADVGRRLRRRQMGNAIKKMKDHVIVIGYGRVGQSVVATLQDSSQKMVLIEKRDESAQKVIDKNLVVIQGDATDDDVLQEAGIKSARTLIVCTGDTRDNLFIVLSARGLNPDLRIITRSDAESKAKMRRAGADRIVSPYQTGGKYMANIALRPHVADFLDVVTLDSGLELALEELTIEAGSELVGRTIGQANIRQRTGVTLAAILRRHNQELVTPDIATRLESGDKLIVLGSRAQLTTMEVLASDS
ncbi:MAG: potassium channel protein [Chloroflexi bacterium]|nr:potassium channel protein [Chloroflexota bacterium]